MARFFSCIDNHINKALDLAIKSTSVETIILSGYGNLVINGRKEASIDTQSYINGYTSSYSEPQVSENITAFRKAMYTTLEKLSASEKNIIFIVDIPELYFNPRECVSIRKIELTHHQLRSPCTLSRDRFEERTL